MEQYIDKSALVAEIKSRIFGIEVSQKAGLIKKRDAKARILHLKDILHFLDTLEVKEVEEKHVSEYLNTESMIESYKQRLILQANGMKNSPLIDMCLASYKHGVNETLDTLKLSNLVRIGK